MVWTVLPDGDHVLQHGCRVVRHRDDAADDSRPADAAAELERLSAAHRVGMTKNNLLVGHTLVAEGAAFDKSGRRIRPNGVGGKGHARCSCGIPSPAYASGNQRREWHSRHKEAIRVLQQPEVAAAVAENPPRMASDFGALGVLDLELAERAFEAWSPAA